jgi:predicted transcriptional regulator
MSDAARVKELLRRRVEELAPYLFPNGKRAGNHWCVGDITGAPGKSFKICIAGEKAGLWGDFADSEKHSRSLLDLWMTARNMDFKTALHEAAEWTGSPVHGPNSEPSPPKPTSKFRTLEDAIMSTERRLNMRATRRDWYHDRNGNEHFVVVRFDSDNTKDFRPFCRNGSAWIAADPPSKLPLFRLPELIARTGELVFIVEGEKSACELATLGLLVTTSAHGAKSANKTVWQPLAGREIVILPDNDAEGRAYAQTVARILSRLSPPAEVRIFEPPGLPPKGDCVDWLGARDARTPEEITAELLGLVRNTEVIREAEKSRPLRVEPPKVSWGFEEWQAAILDNFPAYARPAEICASVIVQLLLNDVSNPFALALVDVPSSGKTITLNFFDVPDLAYTTDNFTPASFVSHASNVKREELANVDMLPRIRYRTLIVRDLAPIFGVKEDELLKTIGILTRALDGEGLESDSGVHGKRGYKGDWLFMLLAGTTPIPPRVFKVMGTLGSRLFFLALHSNTKSHDELIAQNRGTARREKERTCREATNSFLRTLWTANPGGVKWNKNDDPEDCLRVIARCAELLAALRGTIQMWQSEHDGSVNHNVPVIEQPDRINCLLYNLARGHALLCGRTQLATADLGPVLELTFDSAPTIRSKVFRNLLEQNGALKTSQVEKLLRCSKPTALKEMEALTVLGVTDKTEGDAECGRPEHELRLADKFQWFATNECQGLRWL